MHLKLPPINLKLFPHTGQSTASAAFHLLFPIVIPIRTAIADIIKIIKMINLSIWFTSTFSSFYHIEAVFKNINITSPLEETTSSLNQIGLRIRPEPIFSSYACYCNVVDCDCADYCVSRSDVGHHHRSLF